MEEPGKKFRVHFKVREIFKEGGLWILDKPPRVLSHPNPPVREAQNAILRVPYDFKQEAYIKKGEDGKLQSVYLVHRLDQETSGIILLAFSAELAAQLKELFFRREISKQYRALVQGRVDASEGEWSDELVKSKKGGGQIQVMVRRSRRPNAKTRFRVIKRFPELNATLVAFYPETGRTHQLRVQSASRQHPIAGDERYGDFAWNKSLKSLIGLRRMFLHSFRVEFRHPGSQRRLKFLAELDPSLQDPLNQIDGKV